MSSKHVSKVLWFMLWDCLHFSQQEKVFIRISACAGQIVWTKTFVKKLLGQEIWLDLSEFFGGL